MHTTIMSRYYRVYHHQIMCVCECFFLYYLLGIVMGIEIKN